MTPHTIPAGTYEGMLWQSDQPKPRTLLCETIEPLTLTDGENPFCVEGLLWSAATRQSITIRYVDGHYIVRETSVTEDELCPENIVTYLPHRLDGVTGVRFLRRWTADTDTLCEGMAAPRLGETVFVGFETNKEDKQ